jgi:hypothetical protein
MVSDIRGSRSVLSAIGHRTSCEIDELRESKGRIFLKEDAMSYGEVQRDARKRHRFPRANESLTGVITVRFALTASECATKQEAFLATSSPGGRTAHWQAVDGASIDGTSPNGRDRGAATVVN